MACVLQIGAGGAVAHKMAMDREVFSKIILASCTILNVKRLQILFTSINNKIY
ncbi:hypothetical protein [Helicobacter trogontum]|uniref:hypothetical protein n=1 Tax=Helicobacter trogontum TaxID=50960 RepID=UPI000AFBEFFA|nr:hypothetical protein [Helicobacter trogontum]